MLHEYDGKYFVRLSTNIHTLTPLSSLLAGSIVRLL